MTRHWQNFYDYNVPTTIRYPRFPAQKIFQLSAGAYPNKAATSFYGSELTFWQIREQVLRLANALAAIGLGQLERNDEIWLLFTWGESWST